jgi:hypothetical protein
MSKRVEIYAPVRAQTYDLFPLREASFLDICHGGHRKVICTAYTCFSRR